MDDKEKMVNGLKQRFNDELSYCTRVLNLFQEGVIIKVDTRNILYASLERLKTEVINKLATQGG